jgi:hypothetical protein
MTDFTTNIKHFASLNRAPGATWTEATKRKPRTSRSCCWRCRIWCIAA